MDRTFTSAAYELTLIDAAKRLARQLEVDGLGARAVLGFSTAHGGWRLYLHALDGDDYTHAEMLGIVVLANRRACDSSGLDCALDFELVDSATADAFVQVLTSPWPHPTSVQCGYRVWGSGRSSMALEAATRIA